MASALDFLATFGAVWLANYMRGDECKRRLDALRSWARSISDHVHHPHPAEPAPAALES